MAKGVRNHEPTTDGLIWTLSKSLDPTETVPQLQASLHLYLHHADDAENPF